MKKHINNLIILWTVTLLIAFGRTAFLLKADSAFKFLFHYKIHRLLIEHLEKLINITIFQMVIWVTSIYLSLQLGIILIKKFCLPSLSRALQVRLIVKEKDNLVRILASIVFASYFFLYHSRYFDYFFSNFWRRPYGLGLLLIIMMPVLSVLFWLLSSEMKWELLWKLIIKIKKIPIWFFKFSLILMGFFVVLFNFTIIQKTKMHTPQVPNIVLISLNGLRADHLGCYGYKRAITPHIDKLSKECVLFENCFSQSPFSIASLSSMFSSLIPKKSVTQINSKVFPYGKPMVAIDLLKAYNYNIGFFSGELSIFEGFGFNKKFFNRGIDSDELEFEDLVEGAINLIRDNKDQSFFVFLNSPKRFSMVKSKEYLKKVDKNYMSRLGDWGDWDDNFARIKKGTIEFTQDDVQHIINLYDAEIMYLDEKLAILFDFLKDNNLYDDCIIIVTSDRGFAFGEHGAIGYEEKVFYDELLRIPLLIKFPHSQLKGVFVIELVRSIDILPTIFDLAGIENLEYFEGVSLVPLAKGKKVDSLYAVSQGGDLKNFPISSIRTNKWKWHNNGKLFDLESDPGEKKDVSDKHPKEAEFLKNKLDEIINSNKVISTEIKQ
ncbi:MAG: sulfatase [Candidatus Omnitrophica bacterium]|nr:sulfatase [Candidatus Omnitrophota bacterium]